MCVGMDKLTGDHEKRPIRSLWHTTPHVIATIVYWHSCTCHDDYFICYICVLPESVYFKFKDLEQEDPFDV